MRKPLFEIIEGQRTACYDDDNAETFDRYVVLYLGFLAGKLNKTYHAVCMSKEPFHPHGFCQHVTAHRGPHLGKRILFAELPEDCQKQVRRDLLGLE